MRTKLGLMVVGASLCVAFVHCGGGDDSTGAQGDAGVNDGAASDGQLDDAGANDGASSVITVTGILNGNYLDGGALANRPVVIVDANETVTKLTTDANGKFGATGVATPYDIAIPYSLADAGNNFLVPRYYLGISRPDPIVESADEAFAPPGDTTPRMATINVTLTSCVGCSHMFGGGCGGSTGNGDGLTVPLSFVCTWQGSAAHTSPFHGYIIDGTGAFTSGVDIPVQSFNDGDTVQLGTPAMHSVTNASVSVSSTIPPSYTFSGLSLNLIQSDGINFGRPEVGTLTSVDNYPFVPNLNVTVTAEGQGDAGEESSYVVTNAATAVPATIAANVPAAPMLLTPSDSATAVTDARPITWSATSTPSLYTMYVYTGHVQTAVYTTGTTFDPSRLTKAGIGLDAATKYSWAVNTLQNQSGKMDDFVVAPSTASTLGQARVSGLSATRTFTRQ